MIGEPKYFIQNGIVGNTALWHRDEMKGYTCDVYEAHQFTEAEVKQYIRDGEIAFPCGYVLNESEALKTIADVQYLDKSKSITK